MEFKISKRVFYRSPFPVKTSLSFSKVMFQSLKKLADKEGYTVPELIYTVLDQYLVQEAQKKRIDFPDDYEP
jgi:predicted DNA-binding ribbon-helix-helix protein